MQLSMKMCVTPIVLGITCLISFGLLSSVLVNELQWLALALLPIGWMLIIAGIYIGLLFLSQVSLNPVRFRHHRH